MKILTDIVWWHIKAPKYKLNVTCNNLLYHIDSYYIYLEDVWSDALESATVYKEVYVFQGLHMQQVCVQCINHHKTSSQNDFGSVWICFINSESTLSFERQNFSALSGLKLFKNP